MDDPAPAARGALLRNFRMVSLRTVAELADSVGIPEEDIATIEGGRGTASPDELWRWAQCVGANPLAVLTSTELRVLLHHWVDALSVLSLGTAALALKAAKQPQDAQAAADLLRAAAQLPSGRADILLLTLEVLTHASSSDLEFWRGIMEMHIPHGFSGPE